MPAVEQIRTFIRHKDRQYKIETDESIEFLCNVSMNSTS